MAINLPQAIFSYQVRQSARKLGAVGTIAGITFTYLQTRKPKFSLLLGAGLLGYHVYSKWLEDQQRAAQEAADSAMPADGAAPLHEGAAAQEADHDRAVAPDHAPAGIPATA